MTMRALGLGDNVADHYLRQATIYPGGCALNFAAFASMCGAQAGFLGVFRDDPAGRHNHEVARELGVDLSRSRVFHGATLLPKVDIVDGERVFPDFEFADALEIPLLLTAKDFDYIASFDLVHTSIFSSVEQHFESLADVGVALSLDFSDEFNPFLLEWTCPHLTFAELSCSHLSESETEAVIAQAHAFGAPFVIATRGGEGALFSDGRDLYAHEAVAVEARDTMAAGDSFIASFLCSYRDWQLAAGPQPAASDRQEAAVGALARASRFAAEVCMLDGSYGHGLPYPEGVK
jgi:sugar/nucleoside kinase (ribokinase family)